MRPAKPQPTPAFMAIEGQVVRALPREAQGAAPRKFWLVPPRVIVAIVIALMVALMIPGLILDIERRL